MSCANRCQVCHCVPRWTLIRRGDVVVSWACSEHLHEVAEDLQRWHEKTALVVTPALAVEKLVAP